MVEDDRSIHRPNQGALVARESYSNQTCRKVQQQFVVILIELQDITNEKKSDSSKKLVTVNKLSLLKLCIFLYNLPSN